MAETYKIIIIDDHPIFRAGLKKLISEDKSFSIVAEGNDGNELLELLRTRKCDLVIMDISMPGMDGIKTLEHVKKDFPKIKILILTMHNTPEYFRFATQKGADGYILKEDVYENLNLSIRKIQSGRKVFSEKMKELALDDYITGSSTEGRDILSKREKEIISLVAEGFTSKDISKKLDISVRTVESHRAKIMEKLGIHNAAGLIKYALENKLT